MISASCFFFPFIVVVLVWINLAGDGANPVLAFFILIIPAHFVGLLLSTMLSLVFPSVALGLNGGLVGSWKMIRKDFWSAYLVYVTSTTPFVLIYCVGVMVAYVPALAGLEGDPQRLGSAIGDAMYFSTLVAIPVLFMIAVIYSTCSALLFQSLGGNRAMG